MDKTSGESRRDARPVDDAAPRRRSFLAALVGALVGLTPLAAGLGVLLDPLRRKNGADFVSVAPLSAIPDDGVPRAFPVVVDRVDAWTTMPDEPVGLVFLVRQPGQATPIAFTATCPHAGCYVGFNAESGEFRCPCHTSSFHLDGSRIGGENSVAPRDMDTLEVVVESETSANGGDPSAAMVKVEFKRFQTGRHTKTATA
jgi:menaquinol-cytochrome c reductase iron-sulfur subunit